MKLDIYCFVLIGDYVYERMHLQLSFTAYHPSTPGQSQTHVEKTKQNKCTKNTLLIVVCRITTGFAHMILTIDLTDDLSLSCVCLCLYERVHRKESPIHRAMGLNKPSSTRTTLDHHVLVDSKHDVSVGVFV